MKAFWVDDSPKIVVYLVTCEELGSAIVWSNLDDAVREKMDLEDIGCVATLEMTEMTQYDFDSLEEHEGY